jgi:L-ascorbate metabolism protein UlaG (beta-lactamase superfamily)
MTRTQRLTRMIFERRAAPGEPIARPEPHTWLDQAVTGSCLGHSTVLINLRGLRILTDPVFSTRVGPGYSPLVLGPKRHVRPALPPSGFTAPDAILLSHAHFDHLDIASLRNFSRDTLIVTARATADILRRWRFRRVHELSWGETLSLAVRGQSLRVTAVEVAHWGARLMRDVHRGYNGYLLEREGVTVCFAGDTAYTTAFGRLRHQRRALDLMIMPIGAYDPWIRSHCSPEQAVAMANQAGAKYFVPIHHETFRLSDEPMHEPAERLREALAHEPERLLALSVGETFRVPLPRAA